MPKIVKNFKLSSCVLAGEVKQGHALPPRLSSCCNQSPSALHVVHVFQSFLLFVGDFTAENSPQLLHVGTVQRFCA